MATPPIGRLDHVGIAVKSIDAARAFVEGILGASFVHDSVGRDGGFRFAVFDLDGFTIELLEAIEPDNFIATFIEKRGEGVHHITLQTPGLKEKVATLEGAGVRVVDKHLDEPTFLDSFISPKSGCGVLWQLGETKPPLERVPYWEEDPGD